MVKKKQDCGKRELRLMYWPVLINFNISVSNISTVRFFNHRAHVLWDDGNLRWCNTRARERVDEVYIKTLTPRSVGVFLPNGPEFVSFRVLTGHGRSFEREREVEAGERRNMCL